MTTRARIGTSIGLVLTVTVVLAPAQVSASRDDARDPTSVLRRVNRNGTLVCTAEYVDAPLTPGRPIEMSISVTNLSERPQMIGKRGFFVVRPNGQPDIEWTSDPGIGPGTSPERPIGPWKTTSIGDGVTTRVRWSGALKIRPVCPGTGTAMPWILLEVGVPEPPASVAEAIAMATAYPGSPWASCPPAPAGQTTGVFAPPDGATLPPLVLRCWAEVRHEEGFDVVALSLVAPSDGPLFEIPEPKDLTDAFSAGGELPGNEAMLAMRWSFVVTSEEARPVMFQVRERTVGTGDGRWYSLNDGMWSVDPRTFPCGSSMTGVITSGRGVFFDWYTACSPDSGTVVRADRTVLG